MVDPLHLFYLLSIHLPLPSLSEMLLPWPVSHRPIHIYINFYYIPFMNASLFKTPCNSKMDLGKVYFWTNTIKDWKKLLDQNKYKLVIIDSLKHLVDKKLITIFAFVIMPNHIHVIGN